MLPKINFIAFFAGIVEIKHRQSVWVFFPNKKVMSLNMKSRKWSKEKQTLIGHEYPGCLVTSD